MRSRYTAFVLGATDHLQGTWHPSTRLAYLDMENAPQWTGLEIRRTVGGGEADDRGTVEFVARYRTNGRPGALHETSRFLREDGRWYYVDGDIHEAPCARTPSRNAPCPCGSGKKYKRCCGR